jgi:homoserine dehydrogenase
MGGGRVTKTLRLCLIGAGNVGRSVLEIVAERRAHFASHYGVDLVITCVAELGGAAIDGAGLNIDVVLGALRVGDPLAELPGVGRPGMDAATALTASEPDVLLEATPVNLVDGQPALSTVEQALRTGVHVVLANKAPLAIAYRDLAAISDLTGGRSRLRFSATAAGALPILNIGCRDLAASIITRLEGVFNGTTHSILRAMESRLTFEEALADAQRRGIAEADPTLDINGHDSASKLVIAANFVLGQSCSLADVDVEGIRGITSSEVMMAHDRGERLVLLCAAALDSDGRYHLSVRPTPLASSHPLANLGPDDMGVVFHTSEGRLSAVSFEPGPQPAAAAMLRDVLDIARSEPCR